MRCVISVVTGVDRRWSVGYCRVIVSEVVRWSSGGCYWGLDALLGALCFHGNSRNCGLL